MYLLYICLFIHYCYSMSHSIWLRICLIIWNTKTDKRKRHQNRWFVFLTQFTGSRAFTVFYFSRTLNWIIKVQTLRLTNFSGLVCKARLHVLTLSRNILRRVTDRVRFISLYPSRLKEDLCVYCCCWQCRLQFIHATFEKSLLPIETDRPMIFQDADCGPS